MSKNVLIQKNKNEKLPACIYYLKKKVPENLKTVFWPNNDKYPELKCLESGNYFCLM